MEKLTSQIIRTIINLVSGMYLWYFSRQSLFLPINNSNNRVFIRIGRHHPFQYRQE